MWSELDTHGEPILRLFLSSHDDADRNRSTNNGSAIGESVSSCFSDLTNCIWTVRRACLDAGNESIPLDEHGLFGPRYRDENRSVLWVPCLRSSLMVGQALHSRDCTRCETSSCLSAFSYS